MFLIEAVIKHLYGIISFLRFTRVELAFIYAGRGSHTAYPETITQ